MSLYDDLRWQGFADRYLNDLTAFALEVCAIEPGSKLSEAAKALEQGARRLVMHNVGSPERQARLLAVIALWQVATRQRSTVLIGSPTGSACQTNLAIRTLLACMRQGRFNWLARAIKHRASGWFVGKDSLIILRKISAKTPEQLAGYGGDNLMWLFEAGDKLPANCLAALLAGLTHPGTGLVVACDLLVPKALMARACAHDWPVLNFEHTSAPAGPAIPLQRQQPPLPADVRAFIELVAGKPLTIMEAGYLATLLQDAPLAQTPR